MYIEEIILDGFKSYAKRTTVSGFDPFFNAITGLNGSGKSNILDAICFVLGIRYVRPSVSGVRAHQRAVGVACAVLRHNSHNLPVGAIARCAVRAAARRHAAASAVQRLRLAAILSPPSQRSLSRAARPSAALPCFHVLVVSAWRARIDVPLTAAAVVCGWACAAT
jgi:hypothetical protein